MNSIKAMIIDDEPLAHKVILEYTKDIPYLEIVAECHLATEAFTILNNQRIDLIFLDIQMPKLKGLDFIRTLTKKPEIIITSAYEEHALEGFELQVCDYLLKPFWFERFLKAVNKAQTQISLRSKKKIPPTTAVVDSPVEDADKHIFIKVDKKLQQIEIASIQYLESYGNYVKIWTTKEMYLTPATLSSFEQTFESYLFFRIHKSFLVQKTFIDYVEGNLMKMINGKQLTIGKNHRKVVKDWLSKGNG